MKRLLVFIILSILLCLINFGFTNNLSIDKLFPNMTMEIYTNRHTYINDYNKISNGAGDIYFCNTMNAEVFFKSDALTGFMIKFKDVGYNEILKKLNPSLVKQKNFGTYGYSKKIESIISKNNGIKKINNGINFQLVKNENEILLGVPIILGSF